MPGLASESACLLYLIEPALCSLVPVLWDTLNFPQAYLAMVANLGPFCCLAFWDMAPYYKRRWGQLRLLGPFQGRGDTVKGLNYKSMALQLMLQSKEYF